jgi:crotonobetainyl-CoA:carnitine CoA-transferase CaiB-like acyl-CoA transferase
MSGPLEGIRVVDFSRVLAGPLCAQTLLDLGAEVIKVEPPTPDVSRSSFPFKEGMSGYYAQQNAGKRNVSIDLNVAGARELALRLCDSADIVVENFRPGTLGFFGLAYETLAQRNPGLIYAAITGYGQGGPWRGRMAYAPTVQAEAGFTENSIRHYGEALTEPRTDSLSHADVYGGLQAVIAILAALHRRKSTGRGQYIDIAMAATLMAVNERAHLDLSDDNIGAEPAVLGATDCPFFRGPNGEQFTVATSIVGSMTFPSYMRAMRRTDLIDDPRFATAAARRQNLAALHAIIQNWILTFSDMATLDAQFDEAKIAFGEIRSIRELSESDWSDYWGGVREVPDRYGGSYRLPGNPWRFSAEDLKPPGAPAFQGEHNRSVLAELGLTEEEIDRHVASGALVSQVPAASPHDPMPDGKDLEARTTVESASKLGGLPPTRDARAAAANQRRP